MVSFVFTDKEGNPVGGDVACSDFFSQPAELILVAAQVYSCLFYLKGLVLCFSGRAARRRCVAEQSGFVLNIVTKLFPIAAPNT